MKIFDLVNHAASKFQELRSGSINPDALRHGIWRLGFCSRRASKRDAEYILHYIAPVGEKTEYVQRAFKAAEPYLGFRSGGELEESAGPSTSAPAARTSAAN
jgi:hypothetical protein